MDAAIQDVADRQAIYEVLVRYSHGVDRCDLEMLKSAYWPDGTDDHGTFTGNAMEFCEMLIPALKAMHSTMHNIGSHLIDLRGDTAKVQSYCVAYHQLPAPEGNGSGDGDTDGDTDGDIEMVVGGRYLDHMTRRDGEWRIQDRVYVMDWNRNGVSTQSLEGDLYGQLKTRGSRYPHDPFYSFMPES